MYFEVEVGRAGGIAGIADIANHRARSDLSVRSVAAEVRAEVVIAVVTVEVEGEAAERTVAMLDEPGHGSDHRCARLGEEVDAFVASAARTRCAPGVGEPMGTGDRAERPRFCRGGSRGRDCRRGRCRGLGLEGNGRGRAIDDARRADTGRHVTAGCEGDEPDSQRPSTTDDSADQGWIADVIRTGLGDDLGRR